MQCKLLKVPGLDQRDESVTKIFALEIAGKSPALAALVQWAERQQADFKSIMKVLKLIGTSTRVLNESHVTRGENFPSSYEARADKRHARLYFFYDASETGSKAILTNQYWKTGGGKGEKNAQAKAFADCDKLRCLYFANKNNLVS